MGSRAHALLLTLVVAACGSSTTSEEPQDAGAGQEGGLVLGGAEASTPNGAVEVCDGIDNDGDGIVDNVDVGHDGICDCLDIATIGRLGTWSNGTGVFADWLNKRTPKAATLLGDEVITNDKIDRFQIVVLLNVATVPSSHKSKEPVSHPYAPDEAAALAQWVQRGGGLMTTIGYVDGDPSIEIANANALMAQLGVAYEADPPGWILAGDLDVTDWLAHPISAGVSAAHVQNGIRPQEPPGSTTVAWALTKQQVLVVKDQGAGRIAMWGDEWITYDSDWQNSTAWQIERLWLNLFKWLSPPNNCQVPIPLK